ncbi:hypothetical protein KJ819_01050 [Patescibacteria group bacterium]|nr:hypothetical protein [Patescibacteria group bacterium]MBU1500434.1 hypothetical protein [Patescibacteria group bacterium]MBU2080502.1 hypothetical protein [Patescibacteria group bacterium]MBU2123693.1 hypothetical protein [Patescibacteria group bacterium]MBU2194549.1 hypothetical protein [Patescibacteria group bacterium]
MNPDENMNPVETTPEPAPAPEPKKAPAYGAILGIILIVVILVAGAFYVWGERINEEMPQNEALGEVLPDVDGSADVESGDMEPQPR